MSIARVTVFSVLATVAAVFSFALGVRSVQHSMSAQIATNDARVALLIDDLSQSIHQIQDAHASYPAGTAGAGGTAAVATSGGGPLLVEEIKQQIQHEMGLLPVRVLRERRESFLELHAWDSAGNASYGTAGYLGRGYFLTVKHGVVALDEPQEGVEPRRITRVALRYQGWDLPVRVVDAGDADAEVHPGDWAILKTTRAVDLPALRLDLAFPYEFAEPIFRLGNDYSKGIILSTGHVGQRTPNGLVTCLTDGHPGVSGGGILDRHGRLVGISIGRMRGDYRFSFILPLRRVMFRKVPADAGM